MKRRRPTKVKCPRCGKRTIDVRYYRDGDRLYVHSEKPGLLGMRVIGGCFISAKREEMPCPTTS